MTTIDFTNVDWNGEEIKALNECVFEAIFQNPALRELHEIVPGIEAKKQIIILGLMGLTGMVQDGCEPEPNNSSVEASQKFWDPAYIENREVLCWKDFLRTFFVWGLKKGIDKADLTTTDLANFIEERLTPTTIEAVYRIAYFSDLNAENVAEGGVIKDGVNIKYFNPIDGFWAQIFDIVAKNAEQYVKIDRNDGATYADQKFTEQDTKDQVVTKILQKMIDNCDERLTESSDVRFVVTKSVATQYKAERKSITGIDLPYKRVESGMDTLEIDGITIYVLPFMDRMIKSYMNNGTKLHLPHRAMLVSKSNQQIGTEEERNFSELDPFYDKKSKQYIVDYAFNIDAKIVEDYKLMAAY